MGLGGTVVLLVLGLIFGQDFLGGTGGPGGAGGVPVTANGEVAPVQQSADEAELVEFMNYVLNDAQQVWRTALPAAGGPRYQDARLVLFRGNVNSGCGAAQAAMGPFYCPLDQRIYIDLGFYDELKRRFAAPGDFAQAYVLTHEIGHHVQHVIGTDAEVRERQERRPNEANALSVRLELQADCYAGVWANSIRSRGDLDPGDVDEALAAASAVGDDRIQAQSTGRIKPESFTHGTAAQRATWFKRGFESGRAETCNTFAGAI
jgi:predicted metalloprotease